MYLTYICTKGRAGNTKTLLSLGALETVMLVVEPQEYEEYKQSYPNVPILVLQENNRGLMYSRQSVLDHARNSDVKWAWILDDDITGFYQRIGTKTKKVNGAPILSSVVKSLKGSKAIGQASLEYQQYLWSAKQNFVWNSYCDVCVLINTQDTLRKGINFRVEERLDLKGDRDFTFQCLSKGLKTLRFARYGFSCPKNGSNKGGLSITYAQGKESIEVDQLISIWGTEAIQKIIKKDGRVDAKINWNHFKRA